MVVVSCVVAAGDNGTLASPILGCEKLITYAHPLSLDYMCITSALGESGGTGYDLGLIYI